MEDLLDHLCQLARLELSPEERAEFSRKFARLLAFVEQIRELGLQSGELPLQTAKDRLEPAADEPRRYRAPAPGLPSAYAVGPIAGLGEESA